MWNYHLSQLPLYEKVLVIGGKRAQVWIYEHKQADGTYLCFAPDGRTEKLLPELIDVKEAEARRIELQQPISSVEIFPHMIIPSLIHYFSKYKKVAPPYTHWRGLFQGSDELWLTIRCALYGLERRASVKYLPLIKDGPFKQALRRCTVLVKAACQVQDAETIFDVDLSEIRKGYCTGPNEPRVKDKHFMSLKQDRT